MTRSSVFLTLLAGCAIAQIATLWVSRDAFAIAVAINGVVAALYLAYLFRNYKKKP